jgi:serine/threonine protein kinase
MLNLIGQTLDGKYAIERELGRGGMGTVYFANHIGTERPVAVKVIAPQFMTKTEFVERFRREARAAGRLRHPNVVDVTDFGIAETRDGSVAYLVMEYLDGCTLGEILEEEKRIPLSWTLDILEQVCSAVNEAHEQGIIHRDLKPDNIWLEPNQRGGYTVKVLDFGIAKLEEHMADNASHQGFPISSTPTGAFRQQSTIVDQERPDTVMVPPSSTVAFSDQSGTQIDEAGTLIKPAEADSESGTAILPQSSTQIFGGESEAGTQLMSSVPAESGKQEIKTSVGAELTRIGAVLGTPLYMSPEQCRGEKLDTRSDIYSLGVISYQLLGGETPFTGDYSEVMEKHKKTPPPPLQAKKVPRSVRKTVMSALAKDPNDRPPTAEGFASILRSHSEGMGVLLRRGIAIYGEHLPKFFMFSLIIGLPFIFLTILKVTVQFLGLAHVINSDFAEIMVACLAITNFFVQIFIGAIVIGATTWIVAQILARPLRPISLRATVREVRKKWKPLITAVTINTILVTIGIFLCFVPGIWLTTRNMLAAPSIMMEGISARKSFARSKMLVGRSYWTVFGTVVVMHIVPLLLALVISLSVTAIIMSGADIYEKRQAARTVAAKTDTDSATKDETEGSVGIKLNPTGVNISQAPDENGKDGEMSIKRTAGIVSQGIFDLIWAPIVIFATSFISVITALVYFKTRLAGGESMQDLLGQFEEAEKPRSKWQERIRQRLVLSGRSPSKSTSKS